jgi:transposase InsO family protein
VNDGGSGVDFDVDVGIDVMNNMERAQREDKYLMAIRKYKDDGVLPEDEVLAREVRITSDLVIEKNGVLMLVARATKTRKKNPRSQLARVMVPKSFTKLVWLEFHKHATAGHLGFKRTYKKIHDRFVWGSMYADVHKWCLSCIECQKRKGRPGKSIPQPITARSVWDHLSIDFTKLPLSRAGNKYVLNVCDVFSKYVHSFSVPKQNADTVAEKLVSLVLDKGMPRIISSDQGSEFNNKVIDSLMKNLEINYKFAAEYRPQTQGQTERFNRTLKDMVATSGIPLDEWDKVLQSFIFAYNTSIHSATGETPFFLMYGRDAVLPTQMFAEGDVFEEDSESETHVEGRMKKLFKVIARVRERLKERNTRYKRQMMNKARKRNFVVGNRVWLYTRPSNPDHHVVKKVSFFWKGPYRIYAQGQDGKTFGLLTNQGRRLKRFVNGDRLKRCFDDTDGPNVLPEATIDDDFELDDPEFADVAEAYDQPAREISRICGMMTRGKQVYYLCQFGDEEDDAEWLLSDDVPEHLKERDHHEQMG